MFDRRFLRYIVVGLTSTAIDVACVAVLLRTDLSYWLAVTLGFIAGLIVNYLLHVAYTFGARLKVVAQAVRYGTVVALNYLLTLAIVWIGHELLGGPVLAAKIASLPIIAMTGFLLSKYWVFRPADGAGRAA
jgi:putative flippase GtrA